MENLLDRKLCREGVMMREKDLWMQVTSATAAAKSKRSRVGEGRAVGRAFKGGCGLQHETNWQQLWKRRDNSLSPLQGMRPMGARADLMEPGTVDRLRRPRPCRSCARERACCPL
jgi:hypothetical protein